MCYIYSRNSLNLPVIFFNQVKNVSVLAIGVGDYWLSNKTAMYEIAGRAAKLLFNPTFNDLASTNIEEITNTFCGKLRNEICKQETNILHIR